MTLFSIPELIEIKGLQENSLIDWEGKIVSTIFLPYCNFRCQYCYSVELVETPELLKTIPFDEVKNYLAKNKNWIDGVVLCGGEPTIYPELPEFIRQLRETGLLVKLDTNGSNPEILKHLIGDRLVDYVAMDIKGPLKKYAEITGVDIKTNDILESIEILKIAEIDYEFRTTVVPALLDKTDIEEISKIIQGAAYYVLQQFVSGKTLHPAVSESATYSREELDKMAEIAGKYVKKVAVRAR